METTGKDIFYFFGFICCIIYIILWYSGKLKLSPIKEKMRKERIEEYSDLIKFSMIFSFFLAFFWGAILIKGFQ